MVSILIPTYNYNVYPLAHELVECAQKMGVNFELFCMDDGSNSEINTENKKINTLQNSKFIAQKENLGLSNNRNQLAKLAQYDYLLFIDGDSMVIDADFIKNYIEHISNDTEIIYGGRLHPKKIPSKNQSLRWKYGKFIEDKTAEVRHKSLYKTLMFNNTLIKKVCFEKIKFDAEINKYGHEDTLFAYQASLQKLKVKHINNPIKHGDIDTNVIFLKKTELGLINLLKIYEAEKINANFVRILKLYQRLKNYKTTNVIAGFFKVLTPILKKQLLSSNPSLFIFNIYKVGFMCLKRHR